MMEEYKIIPCENGVGEWEISPTHETFDTREEAEQRLSGLLSGLNIGEQIVVPFKPEHHLKNTGVLCIIEQIHDKNVYVRRFSKRNNRWNKELHQVDRAFLEQHKNKVNGVINGT